MNVRIDYREDGRVVNAGAPGYIGPRLRRVPGALRSNVYGPASLEAAKSAAVKARIYCPVGKKPPRKRGGGHRKRLRDSIVARLVSWRHGNKVYPRSAAQVVAEQPHAIFVEKGTKYMPARPFLMPALRDAGLLRRFVSEARSVFPRTIRMLRRS